LPRLAHNDIFTSSLRGAPATKQSLVDVRLLRLAHNDIFTSSLRGARPFRHCEELGDEAISVEGEIATLGSQ